MNELLVAIETKLAAVKDAASHFDAMHQAADVALAARDQARANLASLLDDAEKALADIRASLDKPTAPAAVAVQAS